MNIPLYSFLNFRQSNKVVPFFLENATYNVCNTRTSYYTNISVEKRNDFNQLHVSKKIQSQFFSSVYSCCCLIQKGCFSARSRALERGGGTTFWNCRGFFADEIKIVRRPNSEHFPNWWLFAHKIRFNKKFHIFLEYLVLFFYLKIPKTPLSKLNSGHNF